MRYSIYKLNFPNSKSYIGQTSKSVQERFTEHCWDRTGTRSELNRPIIFAMKKYKGLITYTILEENLTLDEANFLERYYIKFYNSLIDNKCGYNSTIGGNAGSIMSDSGKKRRSEKMKKYYEDPAYVNRITEHLKTPEHRTKMDKGFREFLKNNPDHYSKINIGRSRSLEGNIKAAKAMGGKSFICIETNEIFHTLKQAADHFGSPCKDGIYKVLKGKRKTYKKLHFKYVE